jgi:hypothetical protein
VGATEAETEASNFIDALADKAIEALTVADVPRTERIARFRTLFKRPLRRQGDREVDSRAPLEAGHGG